VRYIFDYNDELMLSIFNLGGYDGSEAELATWLLSEDESESVLCEDEKLARFLNGFIIKHRGPKGDGAPEPERVLSNNMVWRKLSIALDLQSDDLLEMLELNEVTLSKHELSALFRRPGHKNYRECQDQLLCDFLDVMEKHYRPDQA
jgi:uncharacterized protein YehS (DUF1456 family)